MPRSSFVLMLLGMLACAPAYAGEPRLFLSWHAPYGRPGASDRLWMDCQRMYKLDTLFMSFDPGVTTSGFTSFLATIRINALDGDTLSSLWDSPSATGLPVWMKVEWKPDSTSGCGTPFRASGMGGAALLLIASALGVIVLQTYYSTSPHQLAVGYMFIVVFLGIIGTITIFIGVTLNVLTRMSAR